MADIEKFDQKWKIFKAGGRPKRISSFLDGNRMSQGDVGRLFPREPNGCFPATGGKANPSMSGTAFGYWLKDGKVPEDRVAQFESLTGLPIADWTSSLEQFEMIVRREAAEVTDWARYLDGATSGRIRVHAFNGEAASRFAPAGAARPGAPGPTQVWPGCRAFIEIPKQGLAKPGLARRAWMVADYPTGELYVLDPTMGRDGRASCSRLRAQTRLPRSADGYVELGADVMVGTSFRVAVLIVDLERQPEEVAAALDRLEARLLTQNDRIFAAAQHRVLRRVLDDAATLIADVGAPATLYAERCLVVPARSQPTTGREGA